MNTDIALKLKAFALALLINGVVLGGTVVLFEGQMHRAVAGSMMSQAFGSSQVQADSRIFRP